MNAPMPGQGQQAPAPQGQAPMPQQGQQPQQKPQDPQSEAQPVVEAFRTIAMFVKAQEEQGNPQAAQMQQAMSMLITAIQGQGPQQPAAPQGPQAPMPQQAPAPQQPQSGAPRPQGGGRVPMGRGVNPNVGTAKAVPIM